MLFTFISVFVPLVIYFFLPPVLKRLTGKKPAFKLPLAVGCFLFFISWYLPSPLVQGMQTNFVTHFVGGGVFCGFLWVYLKNHLNLKWPLVYEFVAMYFLAAGLGVVNELYELFSYQILGVRGLLTPSDTWWDLLANTLGLVSFWVGYCGYKLFKRRS